MELTKVQLKGAISEFLNTENSLSELLEMVLNGLMLSERQLFLDQPASNSSNKGNGYRPAFGLSMGKQLELRVPRDRLGMFYPVVLALLRDQESLMHEVSFELYSKGLTTRDIGDVLETIYGRHYSKSSISRINVSFYEQMRAWRERELEGEYLVVYIDALMSKVKRGDHIQTEAFYLMMGLRKDYRREIIGVVSFPSESSTGWKQALDQLKERGLRQVGLFVSDGLKALEGAIGEVYQGTPHQKCTVHLLRDILAHVRHQDKGLVAADFREVLDPDRADYTKEQALLSLKQFAHKWGTKYPYIGRLTDKEDISYYFTYLEYSVHIRRMIYSTNWIERFNKSCKRTLKIRGAFPNPEAVLALISSVALDKGEKKYAYPIYNFKFEPKFSNKHLVNSG